jgi:hypothetical protein
VIARVRFTVFGFIHINNSMGEQHLCEKALTQRASHRFGLIEVAFSLRVLTQIAPRETQDHFATGSDLAFGERGRRLFFDQRERIAGLARGD